MRDLVSCYGDHAVKVADATCSGGALAGVASRSNAAHSGVTCLYRSRLSSSRELLVRVTWTRSVVGQGLALAVEDLSHGSSCGPLVLKKKKGSRSMAMNGAVVGLYWDLSGARYEMGPEPVDGFYVVVTADAEAALLLGDLGGDHLAGLSGTVRRAQFCLVGRKEQVMGSSSMYSTRARFKEDGRDHEISIRCKADDDADAKESELWVSIDKKKVVHVRRLRWNFRGNQTIFVDGLPVDMMWDVHDWWFGHEGDRAKDHPSSARAVFMFRTRSALESRLWLEEEILHDKDQGRSGFSLLIHAFKIP